jgi:hypothetical protein
MSLLYKTITYFFPSIAECEFAGEPSHCKCDANEKSIHRILTEPWFIENPDLQLDVLKICWANLAHLINTTPDEKTFTGDITDIILYELPAEFTGYKFFETLVKNIHEGHFLLTQSWFLNSIERQVDVAVAALNNISYMIDVHDSDFDKNLDYILKEHYYSILEKEYHEEYSMENDEEDDKYQNDYSDDFKLNVKVKKNNVVVYTDEEIEELLNYDIEMTGVEMTEEEINQLLF